MMVEFFDWCRKQPEPPNLFGMDCYSLFESKKLVLDFLAEHDPEFGKEVGDRLAYIDKFKTGFEYGDAMVNGNLKHIVGHITTILQKIQATLQWDGKYDCTDLEKLAVEQNCEVIIAADEYYRKSILEPSGSQASWNTRDQHMVTTLLRIKEHLNDPKVVIWAHNSHIGDSTGTGRGGANFERNETWNLGQMVRGTLPNSYSVGFYSYSGAVVAAARWGGPHKANALRPAMPFSYEACFHAQQIPSFFVRCPVLPGEVTPYDPPKLPCTFVPVHPKVNCTVGREPDSNKAKLKPEFVGVERVVLPRSGTVRLRTKGGSWVTEHTPGGNITIHVVPKAAIAIDIAPGANFATLLSRPRLQRWVGVQYHPETELESHYGEMTMARCFNMVVFVDQTKALRPIEAPVPPTNKRLLKEYNRLMRHPVPNIEAHPLEDNILEWHFLIRCDQDPYTSGQYHGVLEFPSDFPMRPPAIKVLTPSGRFEVNKRLCLSMSDYHPESWNPSWSVETVLLGLQSFMYEDNNVSIGSILLPVAERKALAQRSERFNCKNAIFRELFGQQTEASEADLSSEPVCRFCYGTDDLISVCECKGSSQYLHLECLRKWQKSVLLTQSTHPKYQTDIDSVCSLCLTPFKVPKVSRHDAVVAYTGKQVIDSIKVGNLIVASVDSSIANNELMEKHPEIRKDLHHWTETAFLILSARKGVVAVNLSRPIDRPQGWTNKLSHPGVEFVHYSGGPVQTDLPLGFAWAAGESGLDPAGLDVTPPGFARAGPDELSKLAKAHFKKTGKVTKVILIWGYAGWGETQMIAEIARGVRVCPKSS